MIITNNHVEKMWFDSFVNSNRPKWVLEFESLPLDRLIGSLSILDFRNKVSFILVWTPGTAVVKPSETLIHGTENWYINKYLPQSRCFIPLLIQCWWSMFSSNKHIQVSTPSSVTPLNRQLIRVFIFINLFKEQFRNLFSLKYVMLQVVD